MSVLYLYPDEALLWHVDPKAPRTSTLSLTYSDGEWSDPSPMDHQTTGRTLSLDEISPDIIRAAAESAPGVLGVEGAEIDHVVVDTGETDKQECVVSLTWEDRDGKDQLLMAMVDPAMQVIETRGPR